jgi:hypothetical protein
MGYVAQKVMKVDGRRVNPGDPLPGAENWKHLHSLIALGYVSGYPDAPAAEGKKKGRRAAGQQAADQPTDGQPMEEHQGPAETGGESSGVDVQREPGGQ